jgi:nucleoside-diphosphate-sugar epimerase
MGHEVAVFHRGNANVDLPAEHILGDRRDLPVIRPKADVVVDLILSSGAQARETMDTFRGIAGRVVAASSIDVYRACGVLHGSEEGPLEPVPLTEESALRTKLQTYPPEQITKLQQVFGWLDDEYDKIPVERAILSDPELPGTVLRLPMIYGPGDRLHRVKPVTQMNAEYAAWRGVRGYVENVAAALTLAATDERSAGRIYNVAERPAYSELEWARKVAEIAGWTGEIAVGSGDRPPGNLAQHWEADSTRIREELGWREIVPLDEAIRRTVEWERGQPL